MRGIVGVALLGLAGCNLVFQATAPDAGVDDAAVALDCPLKYRPLGSYSISMAARNWPQAELDCENDGLNVAPGTFTHLVVIDDKAELEMLHAISAMSDVWIGLTDRTTEGKFVAVANQRTPFPDPEKPGEMPWLDGEPDGGADDEQDCAILAGSEPIPGLADDTCDAQRIYICECDRTPAEPSRFTSLTK